ncbi:MAG: hypothetical protein HW387_534 [Parachlamydiales bacterium]|nr:hypothetical protein [Parachlamydiales bacterium]
MAAPIQRYCDPRLLGTTLVKPFDKSYQWIRTVAHPLHPKCSLIMECAVRAIKILTGILTMAITSLPALVGRIIQIIHYHSISKTGRLNPPEIVVNNMHLPRLEPCQMPHSKTYHGTDENAAIGILRWGFDPSKTAPGAKMAEAVYVSASDTVSATYGDNQLILRLDLREGEIAYLDDTALHGHIRFNSSDKKAMAAVRELFYLNGYRAIKYDLNDHGLEEGWAVYDLSCISIQQITRSKVAVRMLVVA